MAKRHWSVWLAALLVLVDIVIHLRRSLLPKGNPFSSPLHQQFFLYCVVALVLVIAILVSIRAQQGWVARAALIAWEAGAIAVWLVAYHAPNPRGIMPDEGYVSKLIEAVAILVLLPTLRSPAPAKSAVYHQR